MELESMIQDVHVLHFVTKIHQIHAYSIEFLEHASRHLCGSCNQRLILCMACFTGGAIQALEQKDAGEEDKHVGPMVLD